MSRASSYVSISSTASEQPAPRQAEAPPKQEPTPAACIDITADAAPAPPQVLFEVSQHTENVCLVADDGAGGVAPLGIRLPMKRLQPTAHCQAQSATLDGVLALFEVRPFL